MKPPFLSDQPIEQTMAPKIQDVQNENLATRFPKATAKLDVFLVFLMRFGIALMIFVAAHFGIDIMNETVVTGSPLVSNINALNVTEAALDTATSTTDFLISVIFGILATRDKLSDPKE